MKIKFCRNFDPFEINLHFTDLDRGDICVRHHVLTVGMAYELGEKGDKKLIS